MKRIVAFLIVLAVLCAFCPAPSQAADLPEDIQDGVTLHCFGWSYKNIEANMQKIAAAGYTAVQTSPIQQAKQSTAGSPFHDWWVYYQPATFTIDNTGNSALGTKAEFKSMCATAEKYGVKVIVDVVANHMGEINGNDISPAVIADIRNDASCWHDISKNTTNYSDRYNITQYCMDGLPDLNTSNKKIQNYVLSFLKECVDAGADGFRFDGAKHIETPDDTWCASDFWPTVIDGIKAYDPDVYIYGELLYTTDDGGQLSMSAYTKYMSVTDNSWSNYVRNSVVAGKNAGAFSYVYHKDARAKQLVLWAESHDTYAGEGSGSISTQDIHKTWALVAARADAMSLYFARPSAMSQKLGLASDTGWANAEVAAVNKFHNAFVGQSEYVSSQGNIAYVERGTSGVVLVNCSGTSASVSVTAHTMKDGTYTDAVTGNRFTVSGGKISGQIGSTGVAVVYNVAACAHASHDKSGNCSACGVQVGHSYGSDGKCACGVAQPVDQVIYVVNASWSKVNVYSWSNSPVTEYAGPWPGTAMIKDGAMYRFELSEDAQYVIFNDGSSKTDDLKIPAGKNCYDLATGTWSAYQTAEPESSQPSTEPTVTQPEVTEPQIPQPTEPEITEPIEPEGTQPTQPSAPTQPEMTDPTAATEAPEEPDAPADDGDGWIVYALIGVAMLLVATAVTLLLLRRKNKDR